MRRRVPQVLVRRAGRGAGDDTVDEELDLADAAGIRGVRRDQLLALDWVAVTGRGERDRERAAAILHGDGTRGRRGGAGVVAHGEAERVGGVAVAAGIPRIRIGAAGDDLRAVDGQRVRIRRGAAAGDHADADGAADRGARFG